MHKSLLLFSLLLGGLATLADDTLSNESCLDCHDDPGWTETIEGKEVSMHVDPAVFGASLHGDFDCIDCHIDIEEVPHGEDLDHASCADCHDDVQEEYDHSIHGAIQILGNGDAASCGDCHGAHDIQPVDSLDSPVSQTCARCHDNPGLTEEYRMRLPEAGSHYAESIHGQALAKSGLIVAPSCNDCHGVHNIRRAVDENSMVHHTNID
jgi:predicted CXXCH cytochrome family protein